MKSSALRREIWRDISTGTAWSVIFTLIASVLLTGLAAADVLLVSRINAQAEHYRSSMASIMVMEAKGKINAHACLALSRQPGVHAVVAVRSPEKQVSADALPSSSIRTYESTPGVERILRIPVTERAGTDIAPEQVGAYVSQSVAETLALSPGERFSLGGQQTMTMGIFPWDEADGRRPGFAYSLFLPVPPRGSFDECWVETWPMNPALDSMIRGSVEAGENLPHLSPKLYPFNSSLGATFDGNGLFHDRLSAYAPWLVAVLGVLIGAASVWRRRLEISSDLHAGVARADILVKFMWESAIWVTATQILALPVMTWMVLRNPAADQGQMWMMVLLYLFLSAASCLIGAFLATLSVREKHLLSFFKNR